MTYNRMHEIMEKDLTHDLLDKINELKRNYAGLTAENEKLTKMNEKYAEEITRMKENYAEENRSLAAERDNLISVNSALMNSRSFRIGRGITYLPRKLRDTFLK